jgi:hypothetical protein
MVCRLKNILVISSVKAKLTSCCKQCKMDSMLFYKEDIKLKAQISKIKILANGNPIHLHDWWEFDASSNCILFKCHCENDATYYENEHNRI